MPFFKNPTYLLFCFAVVILLSGFAPAQSKTEILTEDALKKVVPSSFYFAGQSAETQARNTAAARIGENRLVIVGLVDTSGYSTEISGKYEGFFITDSRISLGGKILNTGAYGFGFTKGTTINIFDLSSKQILSVKTISDSEIKRPRPLMMIGDDKSVRLYKGKDYVSISAK